MQKSDRRTQTASMAGKSCLRLYGKVSSCPRADHPCADVCALVSLPVVLAGPMGPTGERCQALPMQSAQCDSCWMAATAGQCTIVLGWVDACRPTLSVCRPAGLRRCPRAQRQHRGHRQSRCVTACKQLHNGQMDLSTLQAAGDTFPAGQTP